LSNTSVTKFLSGRHIVTGQPKVKISFHGYAKSDSSTHIEYSQTRFAQTSEYFFDISP